MKFGQRMSALQYREWSNYYLDYDGLKRLVEDLEEASEHNNAIQEEGTGGDEEDGGYGFFEAIAPSIRSSLRLSSIHESVASSAFFDELDLQLRKIVLFALKTQGSIADQLAQCDVQQLHLMNSSCHSQGGSGSGPSFKDFKSLREKYVNIGTTLLRIIQFVDINVRGIERILKKHDRIFVGSSRMRSSSAYDTYFRGERSELLRPLLHEENLAALNVALETALRGLRQIQDGKEGRSAIATGSDGKGGMSRSTSEPHQFLPLAMGYRSFSEHPVSLNMPRSQQYYNPSEDALLAHIYAARRRMRQSGGGEFVHLLAASSWVSQSPPMLSPPSSILPEKANDGNKRHQKSEDRIRDEYLQASAAAAYQETSSTSSTLNLVSSFIYMANYLIVIPTVTTYSEKLGSSAALSSAIVGMMPFATLFSTVVYSWWTTYSYRQPLISATVCNMIGNFMYALGYPCNSMALVLCGRLLSGFGSCRPINRRYIADAFSTADRTAASAHFVAVGSFGMAAGPFMGSVLHHLADKSTSPYWQVENAPGWFMFVTWSAYLVFLLMWFEDPPKQQDVAVVPSTVDEKTTMTTVTDESAMNGGGADSHGGSEDDISSSNGESRPLLLKGTSALSTTASSGDEDIPIWRNAGVMTNFFIYFVEKLLMECVSSSTSILTYYYFDWPGSAAGIYLAFLCLLILPVNMLVAYLSHRYEDREMMVVMQLATVFGCLVILRYGSTYTVEQYIAGSTILVIFSNMVEGPNMSLLSKTIPKSWRKGFLNVGLLATEAATLGRAVGDAYLALCGAGGLENQLNYTFISMFLVTIITLLISWRYYEWLVPTEDKDD